jgi:hypothetical protein
MAKLADAADLKSADSNESWGFKSPSGHQISICRINDMRKLLRVCTKCAQTGETNRRFIAVDGFLDRMAGLIMDAIGSIIDARLHWSEHILGVAP